MISLEKGSVYYEVKDGPYDIRTDKVFADWAPDECSDDVNVYLEDLKQTIHSV